MGKNRQLKNRQLKNRSPQRKRPQQPTGRINPSKNGKRLPPNAAIATPQQIQAAKAIQTNNQRSNDLKLLSAEMAKNAELTRLLAQTQKQLLDATNQTIKMVQGNNDKANDELFAKNGIESGDRLTDEEPGFEGTFILIKTPKKKKVAPPSQKEVEEDYDEDFVDELDDGDEFDDEDDFEDAENEEEEIPVSSNA